MPRREHLRRLLQTLLPADALEQEHRARMLALLDETSEPFAREQYVPGHVTASAFVTNRAGDSLLLILHGKLKLWLQPGGHIEPDDENVLVAAQREVHEELGLSSLTPVGDGLLDVDVHAIQAHGAHPAHQHFDVRFLFMTTSDTFIAGSDAQAARWVPIQQFLQTGPAQLSASVPTPTDESVLRAVRKIARTRAWA